MTQLKSSRFANDPILEACLNGQHRMLAPQTGDAVKKIQCALRDLGFPLPFTFARGDADGVFQDETARAVILFKQSRGIEPSDPVVGPKTMAALDALFLGTSTPVRPTPPPGPPTQPHGPPPAIPPLVPFHKLLLVGMWNKSTTISTNGGQSMTFVLSNVNILGATVTISANTGEKHSLILLPLQTVQMNFSSFGMEPKGWVFSIETESDAFLVTWQLWSTWVPGDPTNR